MTRTLLIAIVAGVALLAGILVVSSRDTGAAPVRQSAPESPAALRGTWEAKGVVETSVGAADQPVGTTLVRRWVFFSKCTGARCVPWLAREAGDGIYEQAPMERQGDQLRAVFTRATDGCNGQTAELKRIFLIRGAATSGRLTSLEAVNGIYPGCTQSGRDGQVISTLSWKLTRGSPTCPGIPGCRQPG